jgi:uncharacterized small protein (DUF1192 family)
MSVSASAARLPAGIAAIAVLFLAVGCGNAVDKAPKLAVSWGATAQRVGETWLAGEVPQAYARRTARAAREGLASQHESLRGDTPSVSNVGPLRERIDALSQAVERLEAAIAAHDRPAVSRAVDEVVHLTRAIAPWARRGDGA